MARGTAGINAEASCKRQAILPAFSTITLAANPTNMPKAVQSCQPSCTSCEFCGFPVGFSRLLTITSAPRIWAGEFSAAKIGTVAPFTPIPMPRIKRTTRRVFQLWVKPDAIGVAIRISALMKMAPRRPKRLFRGSASQQPLHQRNQIFCQAVLLTIRDTPGSRSYVRSSVDNTDDPTVVRGVWSACVVGGAKLSGG